MSYPTIDIPSLGYYPALGLYSAGQSMHRFCESTQFLMQILIRYANWHWNEQYLFPVHLILTWCGSWLDGAYCFVALPALVASRTPRPAFNVNHGPDPQKREEAKKNSPPDNLLITRQKMWESPASPFFNHKFIVVCPSLVVLLFGLLTHPGMRAYSWFKVCLPILDLTVGKYA